MSLGGYDLFPAECTPVEADKICADADTYEDTDFFSWGVTIIGKKITIVERYMSNSRYSAFKALEAADAPVVFDPQDGSNKTYNVEIMKCTGPYFSGEDGGFAGVRDPATIIVKIMSEVPS